MMISCPTTASVVVDYALEGPRTAAAVAVGKSRLLGMTYQVGDCQPQFVADNLAAVIRSFGDRPRIYPDSLFGLAVEMQHDLPSPAAFDDIGVMLRLLEEPPPPELAEQKPGRSDRASLLDASAARVCRIMALYPSLAARIASEGLEGVYRPIELPVIAPTLAMTLSGIGIDTAVLDRIAEGTRVQMEIAKRQVAELAGRSINLDSSAEVARYLYAELGLPAVAYTRSGAISTAAAALEPLADAHPAVQSLLKYQANKPVHNAAAALRSHVQPGSQRVHADLDPLGTSTGRFSCRDPNLQALPSPLLAAVVALPGNVLLEADFSQCELRILAHFSRDARLLHAYQADGDLHRQTAAAVLQIPPHRVTAKDRQRYGKQINFAVIYGMTAEGLAQNVGLTVVEAQAVLDAYFNAYPGVRQWIDEEVHNSVQACGHVRTLYQRRRQLPAIWSAAPQETAEAQRQAVNTIIQGTAADLMKLALIRLHERLPVVARLLLTVHDSVLLEVPEHLVEQTKRDVVDAMQVIPPGFRVPLKVDCGVGRTWVECKMSH